MLMMDDFFRAMSQRFANDTSSSLRIHWSLIRNFFAYVVSRGLLPKSPLAPRKIEVDPEEVVIPEEEDINEILRVANQSKTQKEWLYIQTLIHMGQAPIDTIKLKRKQMRADGHVSGMRSKTRRKKKQFNVDLPLWLADLLRASKIGGPEYFFWDGVIKPGSAVKNWYLRLRPIFAKAKTSVHMHPYLFRHYFISNKIAEGWSSDEVAGFAGNSVAEIEKTYAHLLHKGADRVRAKLIRIRLEQGLDEFGNTPLGFVQ